MGLEFNPKVTTDEQLLKQKNTPRVHTDSTRTNTIDIHTAEKLERAKRSETSTNVEVRQTQAPAPKPTPAKTTGSGKKPVPQKPTQIEITVTSTNSSQPIIGPDGEVSGKTLVGSFDTNIPLFDGLNGKNIPATAEASGVGIYNTTSTSPSASEVKASTYSRPVVKHFEGPPAFDEVSFTRGFKVKIPQQPEPVKGTIVYDEKTQTYAFNNIEGIEIDAVPGKDNGVFGGQQILISGGSVARINTAEQKNYLFTDTNGKKYYAEEQTIVLQNTIVEDGALSISQDKVISLGNTQIDASQIKSTGRHHLSSATPRDVLNRSYYASDNNTTANRPELQTGISTRQALTNWLGASEDDVNKFTSHQADIQGTLEVQDERFSAANMENASVARSVGNLNIYTTDGDGTKVTISEGGGQNGKTRMHIADIDIEISAEQMDGAKIFVDRETHTIVMENVQGVEIHPDDKNRDAYRVQTNLLLKDCQVDYISTRDRNQYDRSFTLANRQEQQHYASNIGAIGDTTIATLITDGADKVLLDDNAQVQEYWGYETQTNSEALDKQNNIRGVINNTSIAYAKRIPDELGGHSSTIAYD